jgi:hypothetical protein
MLHSGYLTVSRPARHRRAPTWLVIPNAEVRDFFSTTVSAWLDSMGVSQSRIGELAESLAAGDLDRFVELVRWFAQTLLSYYTTSKEPEGVYQAFVLGLLASVVDSVEVESEKEAGSGRCDIVLADKKRNFGVVIELKKARGDLRESAQKALEQIRERGYIKALEAKGIENVYVLALAFRGKEVEGLWQKV